MLLQMCRCFVGRLNIIIIMFVFTPNDFRIIIMFPKSAGISKKEAGHNQQNRSCFKKENWPIPFSKLVKMACKI